MKIILSLLTFYFLLPVSYTFSQNITATATLDTNTILIGQQTRLKLKVEYKTDQGELKIDFPKIADTLIKQIEVVSQSKIEKFIPDSNDMSTMAQMQTLIITSFDSGYYAIPPFKFVVSGDSNKALETEPMLLTVNTVAVDTTKNIMDIKPPIEVPFSWKEYLPYVYWGLGAIALLALIIYLVKYYLKKRKKKPLPEIIIPKIPPHITALEELEKLKEEKLWQQGKLKEYHSRLSDIIRQYIEHRFYINAMEQVTDEIMYSFRTADASEEQKMKLRNMLFLSDLVKFAKEQPLPNENESSLTNAFEFVMATKQEIKKEEAPSLKTTAGSEHSSDKDNNSLLDGGKTNTGQ
ncbi:MAG: hypothetical protein HY841_05720 [Bacteroidetes bacterium]|nr:hypothetical protein [Bacteroidota bacterium]